LFLCSFRFAEIAGSQVRGGIFQPEDSAAAVHCRYEDHRQAIEIMTPRRIYNQTLE
jgi:hypothetical protein